MDELLFILVLAPSRRQQPTNLSGSCCGWMEKDECRGTCRRDGGASRCL